MCGKVFLHLIFLCVIANVWSFPDVEEDLKEQSLLYGIALETDNITICEQELKLFIEGIRRREIWALNMLDSSGQEDAGYLFINYMWMGSMSQCRNSNLNQNADKTIISPYKVEFKTVLFNHNNTMQEQYRIFNNEYLQIGLCLPKSCSTNDIFPLIVRTVAKRQLLFLQNYPVEISVLKVKSLSEENNDWIHHPMVKFTLIVLFVILLLTLAGSYYDIWINAPYLEERSIENRKEFDKLSPKNKLQEEPSWWSRVLLCYSFPANVRSLFDTSIKEKDSLPVVYGLKALGTFFIVSAHIMLLGFATDNIRIAMRYFNVWYFQYLAKCIHGVDTFFCLSGFVLSYAFCKYHKDKKPYALLESVKVYVQMILHRVLKILPSYMVTIGITVTLWRYVAKTYPIFRLMDLSDETCPTYWYRNLLFINTWYPARTEMCMTWTWYISHDMQFYALNCVLLLLSMHYPRLVLIFLKFLVVYSILQTGWFTYTTSYIHTTEDMLLNEIMYFSSSVRMTPYSVGVLAGYYFNQWNGKIPLSDRGYRIGWIICLVTFLYVVQGLQYPTYASQQYTIFYVSLSKFLWGSCTAWLIMACLSGQGGVINKFLSQRCWIPLSRVTFGVYFTNLIVVNMYAYTGEKPIHYAIAYVNFNICGNIAVCYLFGTLFSLIFETPSIKIVKLLLISGKNKAIKHGNKNDAELTNYKLKSK